MARGWDSKSVEAQIEENRAVTPTKDGKAKRTPAQQQKLREKRILELARTKILADMQRSDNPRFKQMRQHALDDLDQKLAKLAGDSKKS